MSQFMEAGATKQDPSKDFEKLIGEQGEIINVIEQMKGLDPTMINKIRTKLLTKIDNLLNILMEPLKQKIIDEYMKGDGFDKKIMANIKNECNSIKKQIQPLIDAVSGLVSVKGTSNKKQNLKRLMRTEKRNANVSKALTMSMNEKFEILEKNCQIIGCLMIEINSSRIKPLFQNFILDNFIESTETLIAKGAEMIVNISASPYRKNIINNRHKVCADKVKDLKYYFIYCNLVGGQDELVFDGHSFIIDTHGDIKALGKGFKEDYIDFNTKNIESSSISIASIQ